MISKQLRQVGDNMAVVLVLDIEHANGCYGICELDGKIMPVRRRETVDIWSVFNPSKEGIARFNLGTNMYGKQIRKNYTLNELRTIWNSFDEVTNNA